MDSILTAYNLECLIKSLNSIRDAIVKKDQLSEFPAWQPLFMKDTIDFETMNDFEWDVQQILNWLTYSKDSNIYCGEKYCGENGVI